MPKFKILQGILVLIDIINFTSQSQNMGDNYTARYTEYFNAEINRITRKHGFRVIKFMGDSALIFGKDPVKLLEIMLDLFDREKPGDKFGFLSRFRMVGHSGFFQFQMKGTKILDLVSPEGIKVFRMEKYAAPGELMVTNELFRGVKALLTDKNIQFQRKDLNEPLKGFDNEEWLPPFYQLTTTEKQTGASNLLEQRLDDLARQVEFIPVFGNIYPPVPMDKNFINLSLDCYPYLQAVLDFQSHDNEKNIRGKKKKKEKKQDDWIFHHRFGGKSRADFPEIDVNELFQNIKDQYTNGLIFGLPGAGKTTILRHLAYKEFRANKDRGRQKRIVLFVPCRDIYFYDTWHIDQYGPGRVEPDKNTALEYMTWVFLFGGKTNDVISPKERVEFRNAVNKVKQAFKENRLTLLVDALDEAPDSRTKERIVELVRLLTSKNRVFLTSRPSEQTHLRQENLPVFNVLSLNMEQVRAVARHLMDPGSFIYKKFDEAIWQEEVVVKMAATPITALLVTAYFQAYGQFDHRFPMYDLLMKFILVKVWEKIKTDNFPYKNLELFFKEIKKPGFFEKYKDAGVMYEGIGSLCFQLFFQGYEGKIHRSVNEETLQGHFKKVISENFPYDEEKVASIVDQWIGQFQQDHLLLQAGAGEYVFVHSAMMEYLAAFHMIRQAQQDINKLTGLVGAALKKEDFLPLETLPIAAGNDLLNGFKILEQLRDIEVGYDRELRGQMGIRCLAELEWQITKTFQVIRIESLIKPVQDIIRQNQDAVEWIYNFFKDMVLSTDKDCIRKNLDCFEAAIKFSRHTLFDQYLDYKAFEKGDPGLVELRKQLLLQLVQKELLEQWFNQHREKQTRRTPTGKKREIPPLPGEQGDMDLLQLDTPGYNPDDKNFAYHREYIRIHGKGSGITGKELKGFFGSPNLKHSGGIRGCAFSPDGKTILSASYDKTLKLWDVKSGKEIRAFTGHQGPVNGCAFSPDCKTIVSCSNDESLKLWDVKSGKKIRAFIGHDGPITGCVFSPDGKTILSGSSNGTLKLWDTADDKEIRDFTGHIWPVKDDNTNGAGEHKLPITSFAFSPDSSTILSGSSDGTLKLWDAAGGKEIRTFTAHMGSVFTCAYSPDGKAIVSGSSDGTLKLWDVDSGKEIRTFTGHNDWFRTCAFSPDGETILSGSSGGILRLWDAATGEEIRTFTGHEGIVFTCAFSPDGKTIVSGSYDRTLKLWDAAGGKEINDFIDYKGIAFTCAFSPDGKTIASGSEHGVLNLWDAVCGKKIRAFAGHQGSVFTCAFSPDGKTILSGSSDDTLKLWDLERGNEIHDFTGHKSYVNSCVFSPDGQHILSGSSDSALKLWDAASGKEIRAFTGHKDWVKTCTFAPDGKTVLSGSADKTLKLWAAVTGKEIRTFPGHNDEVNACAFSPDEKTILSGSADGTLRLWDAATGKGIRTFTGHNGYVWDCAFSPDGKTLISVADDHTLRLWDAAAGTLIKTLELPWIPKSVSLSPTTPGLVITANLNGTLTLFELREISGFQGIESGNQEK